MTAPKPSDAALVRAVLEAAEELHHYGSGTDAPLEHAIQRWRLAGRPMPAEVEQVARWEDEQRAWSEMHAWDMYAAAAWAWQLMRRGSVNYAEIADSADALLALRRKRFGGAP